MFDRLTVPTPFEIGPVNAYLAGRTLIDPGPNSEEAWSTLLEALETRDLAPEDVEQVLLTHPHPDHFGIAARFRERGATVMAAPPCAHVVGDFAGRLAYEQSYFSEFFQRCGMDAGIAETVTQLPEAFLHYVESVDVDRELTPKDTVTVAGQDLIVDSLAGHAPGELRYTYTDDDRQISVVGDHVLPAHTPNPFLQPPPEDGEKRADVTSSSDDGDRPRVLPAFNDSLRALQDQGVDQLRPGHGPSIADPHARIAEILDEHQARTAQVADQLDGPTTPLAVMDALFDDLPATEQFAGMSEAVGHLDVLEARERVRADESCGRIVYERIE